jgi:hypothetical protein
MSAASSLPYKLRPNKAVDRELFLALLVRVCATLRIESYRYIGLGGAFLEDFRLIHAKTGIDDMVCIDSEEATHLRQKFNRPVEAIECVHSTLEEYIDGTEFDKPVIIWFDYTDPDDRTNQIERFGRTIAEVPLNSILRITLNASPSSLGKPKDGDIKVQVGAQGLQEWRLAQFKERMGPFYPDDCTADDMQTKAFGSTILKALYLSAEKAVLSSPERKIIWALATHYADGQPMVTATLFVVSVENYFLQPVVDSWNFKSDPLHSLRIDMPTLSTVERLTMEAYPDAEQRMGYALPKSDLGENPFDAFRRFYRVFPHFARVDL